MKFTKKAFTQWLNGKRSGEKVGNPESIHNCPLCNFLMSQGAKSVSMGFSGRTVDGKRYGNPIWAAAFQSAVCKHVDYDETKYITAKTAFTYLG